MAEWLFDDDPDAAAERQSYDRLKLPVRHVNIRAEGLKRLTTEGSEWRYLTRDFDMDVLEYLQRHWPLDYRDGRKPPAGAVTP